MKQVPRILDRKHSKPATSQYEFGGMLFESLEDLKGYLKISTKAIANELVRGTIKRK